MAGDMARVNMAVTGQSEGDEQSESMKLSGYRPVNGSVRTQVNRPLWCLHLCNPRLRQPAHRSPDDLEELGDDADVPVVRRHAARFARGVIGDKLDLLDAVRR